MVSSQDSGLDCNSDWYGDEEEERYMHSKLQCPCMCHWLVKNRLRVGTQSQFGPNLVEGQFGKMPGTIVIVKNRLSKLPQGKSLGGQRRCSLVIHVRKGAYAAKENSGCRVS